VGAGISGAGVDAGISGAGVDAGISGAGVAQPFAKGIAITNTATKAAHTISFSKPLLFILNPPFADLNILLQYCYITPISSSEDTRLSIPQQQLKQ